MTDPVKADPPSPNWKTKAVVFGITVIGALPFSGLLDGHPTIAKIVGVTLIGLGAIGYSVHSTSLVDAHEAGKAIGS